MKSEFKNHLEAWQQADKDCPADIGLIHQVQQTSNMHLKTKEDFRWFVLFNYIRSIDEKLNRSKEHTYLRRIQQNILHAAERLLK